MPSRVRRDPSTTHPDRADPHGHSSDSPPNLSGLSGRPSGLEASAAHRHTSTYTLEDSPAAPRLAPSGCYNRDASSRPRPDASKGSVAARIRSPSESKRRPAGPSDRPPECAARAAPTNSSGSKCETSPAHARPWGRECEALSARPRRTPRIRPAIAPHGH